MDPLTITLSKLGRTGLIAALGLFALGFATHLEGCGEPTASDTTAVKSTGAQKGSLANRRKRRIRKFISSLLSNVHKAIGKLPGEAQEFLRPMVDEQFEGEQDDNLKRVETFQFVSEALGLTSTDQIMPDRVNELMLSLLTIRLQDNYLPDDQSDVFDPREWLYVTDWASRPAGSVWLQRPATEEERREKPFLTYDDRLSGLEVTVSTPAADATLGYQPVKGTKWQVKIIAKGSDFESFVETLPSNVQPFFKHVTEFSTTYVQLDEYGNTLQRSTFRD